MGNLNLKQVKSDTWIRTIALILALINQILALAGKDKLPFTEDTVYQIGSLIFTTVTSFLAWWKNNSFTNEAIEADKTLSELKETTK